MTTKPGRFNVIFRDYWSFILFAISLGTIILGPLAVLTIPAGLFLTFRRVGMIRKAIADGQSVDAILTHKRRTRGEWILRYQYEFDGNRYDAMNIVIGWNLYGMKVGDRLNALVNPTKPSQAYLAKLYINVKQR